MASCQQSQHQTILQHGEAVSTKGQDLLDGRTEGWRLPSWFVDHREGLLASLPSRTTLETYWLYHDAGKPYCRTVDADGRQHFPNHAQISASVWRVLGGSEEIAELIQRDMDCHIMKPAELATYDRKDLLPTLLLTALAELHANAEMFGGIESTSFKIKWKALNKLGNAFFNTKE